MADSPETNTIAVIQRKLVDELRQRFEIQVENPVLSPTSHSKPSEAKPRPLPKPLPKPKPKVFGTRATAFQHGSGDTQGDASAAPEIDSKEKAEAGSPRNVADEEDIKALGDLSEAEQDTQSAHLSGGSSIFYFDIDSHELVDDQEDQQTKEDRLSKTEDKHERNIPSCVVTVADTQDREEGHYLEGSDGEDEDDWGSEFGSSDSSEGSDEECVVRHNRTTDKSSTARGRVVSTSHMKLWKFEPNRDVPTSLLQVPQDRTNQDSLSDQGESNDEASGPRSKLRLLMGYSNKLPWCEMPGVKSTKCFERLTPAERRLQEALFEIIASEAIYVNRLHILITVFYEAKEFFSSKFRKAVISEREKKDLFLNIRDIWDVATQFLTELECLWDSDVMLNCSVCDVITKFAIDKFKCYEKYTVKKSKQEETMEKLSSNPRFVETLRQIQRQPKCKSMNLLSYLLEPLQRFIRYPLLLKEVIKHLSDNEEERSRAEIAHETIEKIVSHSNELVDIQRQQEKVLEVAGKLVYKGSLKWFQFSGRCHRLLKEGQVKRVSSNPLTVVTHHLFIFNDVIFITIPQSDGLFEVVTYVPHTSLKVRAFSGPLPQPELDPDGLWVLSVPGAYAMHDTDYIMASSSAYDAATWVAYLLPKNEGDRANTDKDCWRGPTLRQLMRSGKKLQWCEVPRVRRLGLVENLSTEEKMLQEALFEILSSEACYVNRLDFLITVFYEAKELSLFNTPDAVVTKRERNDLFLNICDIRDVAAEFLADLERQWDNNVMLTCSVCDTVTKFADEKFNCYRNYTKQRQIQMEQLSKLMRIPRFCEALQRIQNDPRCDNLYLASWLLAPQHRFADYPEILQEVMCHLDGNDKEMLRVKKARAAIKPIASRCDSIIVEHREQEKVFSIASKLVYKDTMKVFLFDGNYHRLVKDGRVKRMLPNEAPVSMHLFLFNDVIFITRPDRFQLKVNFAVILYHYCEVITGAMASQITSLTIVYSPFIQAQIKESIKAPSHWPLCGVFTGDRVNSSHKSSDRFEVVTYLPRADLKVETSPGHLTDLDLDPTTTWIITVPGGFSLLDVTYVMATDSESDAAQWRQHLAPGAPFTENN